MSGGVITYTQRLEVTTCWCGINYAVPANLLRNAMNGEVKDLYCPLGHGGGWGDTELQQARKSAQQARDALTRKQAELDQAKADTEHERRRAAAARAQTTKIRKRAAVGVCPAPSCKRSFVDMAKHVATCHPELATVTA